MQNSYKKTPYQVKERGEEPTDDTEHHEEGANLNVGENAGEELHHRAGQKSGEGAHRHRAAHAGQRHLNAQQVVSLIMR